mgnify:FL=1|tara:strand:+ start:1866 stop:2456 length:591 start_codon:yes stop_codon:yes gene_type:complete
MKKITFIVLFICLVACKNNINYYSLPLYSSNNILTAVIEIPSGTNKKYEYNNTSKAFEIDQKNGIDRVVQYLPYLGNYGYFPSTYSDPKKGGDGDALDVLVLSESVTTASVVEVIPIGVLKLIDDGELDYKIISIPADPSKQIIKVNSFSEFSQKYPEVKKIIELWFLNYNKDDEAKIKGWGDEVEALNEIKSNIK